MSKRLNAYTLTELLVVLILASLLLSGAMMLYTNVSSYQRRLQTRATKLRAFDRLEYYLLNDLKYNEEMQVSGRRMTLKPSGIVYYFYGESIERVVNDRKDTWPLSGYVFKNEDFWDVHVDIFRQEAVIRLQTNSAYRNIWLSTVE